MGCSSTKPSASSDAQSKTLLTSPSTKTAVEYEVQHNVAHVTLKPGSLEKVVEVASNADAKRIFDGVDGLMDVQIIVAENNKLIVQSAISAESKTAAAHSKIDEVLKLMEGMFADQPVYFAATGGSVKLAGQQVWSLTCPGLVHHEIICAKMRTAAASNIHEFFGSDKLQTQLQNIVGLVGMEAIMQDGDKLSLHARFVSQQARSACETVMQEVMQLLSAVLEEQHERFHATGGHIKLTGSHVWSFPVAPQTAVVNNAELIVSKPEDEDTMNQQFPCNVEATIGKEVQELVVLPSSQEAKDASKSWFFGTCCAAPAASQA